MLASRKFFSSKASPIRLVECPRDAMQGLAHFVPTSAKIKYINALLKCGFYAIDCASFVSPRAVPQMRDSADVLAGIDRHLISADDSPKLSVVVASQSGFKRALDTPIVNFIGFPLSCCEKFQELNTKKSIADALREIALMQDALVAMNARIRAQTAPPAADAWREKELLVYLSMGFGNPYGEPFSVELVEGLARQLSALGIRTISLADTVGISEPTLIHELITRVRRRFPETTFSAHFHSNTVRSQEKLVAALGAGCRMFDSALGGMGGCPFAKKGDLIGNIATELVVQTLEERKELPPGIALHELSKCVEIKQNIFGVSVQEMLLSQTLHDEKRFAALCQEHFKLYDAGDTGVLDYAKFKESMLVVFAELGRELPSEDKIRSSFQKIDIQKLGVITLDAYMMGARRLLMKKLGFVRNGSLEINDATRTLSA